MITSTQKAAIAVCAFGLYLSSAVLLPTSAQAVLVCVNKKSGAIRVTATCRRPEVRSNVDAAPFRGPAGPQGPQGPQGAPGPQGAKGDPGVGGGGGGGGVRIYDANWQALGYPLDDNGKIVVAGLGATLQIQMDDWTPSSFGDVPNFDPGDSDYATADCTGQAYYAPVAMPFVAKRSGANYLITPREPVALTVRSSRSAAGCVATSSPYTAMRTPDFDSIPVTLPFTVPVKLPLRLQ